MEENLKRVQDLWGQMFLKINILKDASKIRGLYLMQLSCEML